MLDAFIIEKIRKERTRQQKEGRHLPLEIRRPPVSGHEPENAEKVGDETKRGVTVIDLSV